MIYAGIGSRETPSNVLTMMTIAAKQLCDMGWMLRTGGAEGADKAFAAGTAYREIHIPWSSYNGLYPNGGRVIVPEFTPEIRAIAMEHHPAWDRLTEGARKLMMRNVTIILGEDLRERASMIICWTPGAAIVGGTGHGLRVASSFDVPVFNLASEADQQACSSFVEKLNQGETK